MARQGFQSAAISRSSSRVGMAGSFLTCCTAAANARIFYRPIAVAAISDRSVVQDDQDRQVDPEIIQVEKP